MKYVLRIESDDEMSLDELENVLKLFQHGKFTEAIDPVYEIGTVTPIEETK